MQEQLEQSQEAMANARGEVTSEDGTVTVAVAGGGSFQSIDLTPKSLELGHTKLASTITATIHKAQSEAARAVQESMRPLLGDGDAMSFLGEQVGRDREAAAGLRGGRVRELRVPARQRSRVRRPSSTSNLTTTTTGTSVADRVTALRRRSR